MPVYNLQKYINKAIESVVNQTFSDYELIIIDDGSTDQTLNVCMKYSEKYENIKIITQKNSGVSTARNNGINKSIGKYLIFLDGDDWWKDHNMLEKIHYDLESRAGKAELYTFSYERYYEDSTEKIVKYNNFNNITIKEKIVNTGEFIQHVLYGKEVFCWFSWLYVYKAEIIRGKRYFDNKIAIFEDTVFLYSLLKDNIKIFCTSNVFYSYRCKRAGAATDLNVGKMEQLLGVSNKLITDALWNSDYNEDEKRIITNNLAHSFYLCLIYLYAKGIDKERLREVLKCNIGMTKYTTAGKDVVIKKMLNIAGISATGLLLHIRSLLKKI